MLFHRLQGKNVPPQVEPKTEEERTEQVSQLVMLMYTSRASSEKQSSNMLQISKEATSVEDSLKAKAAAGDKTAQELLEGNPESNPQAATPV